MKPLLTLIGATLCCAIAVYFGPKVAEGVLPWFGPSETPNYPAIETLYALVIFGSLLLFGLIGAALTRTNPLRLGRRPLRMALLGLGIGVFGIGAAAAYTWVAHTLVRSEGVPPAALVFLWGSAVVLFQSATEEVYFRGWLQPVLASAWGVWPAIFLTTLVFALLHLLGGATSLFAVLNLFLGGLLFGMLAVRAGGIAGSIAAHFGWNWAEQLILGLYPNPGTGSFSALMDWDLTGSDRWGGSAEGLNASAAMTFALIALLVPLLIFWSRGRGIAALRAGSAPS